MDPSCLDAAEVARRLDSDPTRGLDQATARARLAEHGPNELIGDPVVPRWLRFLRQLRDPLVLLLLAATAISLALWLYQGSTPLPYEALAILAIVLVNAVLGYVQEARAEASLAALRAMSASEATVVRGGRRQRVPARELVPGDLLVVEEGDSITADARVVESIALHTAEAALTGESLPVAKSVEALAEPAPLGDRHDMVFSGTTAAYGRGRALVTSTGMRTEIGRIAQLVGETRDEATPLQRELDRTGRLLGLIVVAIAIVMVGTLVAVTGVDGVEDFIALFILAVALAVAAVPEGLPAVVTTVLSLGVQRMARRNAIVRHLAAVETLGSANVIASDKTGTLTRNEMTVRSVVTASGRVAFGGSGYLPEGRVTAGEDAEPDAAVRAELSQALIAASRASNATLQQVDGRWTVQGDPTEAALIVAARKAGLDERTLDARFPRVGELPFSSARKMMSTLHRDVERSGRTLVFTKGAPDLVLARCTQELVGDEPRPLDAARRAAIEASTDELAAGAMRTLAIAMRTLPEAVDPGQAGAAGDAVETGLCFLAVVGIIDPPRREAAAAVSRARAAGIRPLMVTGDHPGTAGVIAKELGISTDGRAIAGRELERMSDDALDRAVLEVSVYARVEPKHKLRIVDALQRHGAIVAMTGDGVNDAPALKAADIGVAMGITGTDVAKQAAHIVLADDDFGTIVAAAEEGRAIFANIRKFLRFLLSCNVGEVATMFLGVLFARQLGLRTDDGGVVLPMLATQLLWINLATDAAPALALGVEPKEPELMRMPPRPGSERVITGRMWLGMVLVGLVMAAGTLLVLDAGLPGGLVDGDRDLVHARTMAFTTLMLFQLFNVFNARSSTQSAFVRPFTNGWIWLAVAIALLLQVAVLQIPALQRAFGTTALGAADWLGCVAVASSVLWLAELAKWAARWRRRGREFPVTAAGR